MVTDLPVLYNEGSFVHDVLLRVFSCSHVTCNCNACAEFYYISRHLNLNDGQDYLIRVSGAGLHKISVRHGH